MPNRDVQPMTDTPAAPPIDAAGLTAIIGRHRKSPTNGSCNGCYGHSGWPCERYLLATQLDAVTRERDDAQAQLCEEIANLVVREREVAELREWKRRAMAEGVKLEAALAPFAKAYWRDIGPDGRADTLSIYEQEESRRITVGDCRRAHEIIQAGRDSLLGNPSPTSPADVIAKVEKTGGGKGEGGWDLTQNPPERDEE